MTIRRQAAAGSPLFTVGLVLAIALAAPSSAAAAGLFDRVGIGTNWGPHWSPSPSVIDARDNQADGAFPAELCLLRNAGFKTIRMYGENSATWISVLDAVDDYNTGKLNCNPGGGVAVDCQTSGNCMSVIYQVGICGPDPRSLAWNGSYTDIGSVKCYEVGKTEADEGKFADSVADELLKLKQVLRAAGDKFAMHVPLVFVGNEILFSRGVCGGGPRPGAACTDTRDCGTGGSCGIAHYCSNALTGSTPSASCSSSATCGAGTCTDVTNLDPLKYAFAQVQQLLSAQLPAGSVPAISMSLQVDLVASGSFGDDGSTLMYSRQQLAQALPNKVIAVNTYPDQWGKVTIGQATQCLVPSFPSCVGPSNAVKGQALLAGCVDDPRYRDPRTQKIAHTIDNYIGLLRNVYYPGFDVMIAETGWHTAGTCGAYNDCTATYSPQDAATYYKDLYAYAQTNQVPLLAFQLFDERTKQCDLASGASGEMAEANYGLFSNFCQLKGANAGLVPPAGSGSPGPNLTAFNALLDTDGSGKSCAGQALLGVIGVGNTGVCEHNPTISCNGGYHLADPTHGSPKNDRCPPGPNNTDNRCVWGYCASKPTVGCNPDDAGNDPGCGDCRRAGSCAATAQPQPGLYLAVLDCAPNQTCGAACWTGQSCNAAKVFGFQCTDQTCGCYAAMTPSTPSLTKGADAVEAPGFVLSYGKGQFEFTKTRTLRPEVFAGDYGIEVHAVWSNAFVGKDWTVTVSAPAGFEELDPPGPCPENTVTSIGGTAANPVINWKSGWTTLCNYPVGGINAVNNLLSFPRGFLSSIPTWPPPVFCLSATGGCGGGTPGPVGFSAASGKAQNVGVATDSGNLRLSGRFTARSALQLDRAAVTVNGLLHEVSGAGELSRRAGGGALLPVTLGARAGSKPTSAIYQTASGVRPSVRVELKVRDARTRAMDFSITVDRDSMPAPTACAGNPSKTQLRTNFIIDDGSDQPLSIDTILPWQCRGNELRLP